MDFPVKLHAKSITLVPSFFCWKILLDLEIDLQFCILAQIVQGCQDVIRQFLDRPIYKLTVNNQP